ncbi:hypothetical protein L1049_018299 [Liquidambar formosana]|uniref:MSP domain-containing protein n=1 Tax=Liquidambar formosana TaxID=63359 RepID=A0AAP0WM05_LIQFO
MASLAQALSTTIITIPHVRFRSLKVLKSSSTLHGLTSPHIGIKHTLVCCTKLSPWEPSPVTYAPTDEAGGNFLEGTTNIFETLNSEATAEAPVANIEEHTNTSIVPTLWLPLSSIFLGPNIASLLSLIGLDCIFNLGATLFLLMADSCAQPINLTQAHNSKAPFSYQFWNIVATVAGFIIPLTVLLGSQKGFLQPPLPFISSAVLLGPYLLLLSVQILIEMLTWHWQSPVWLVTPIVYGAYRVLQLMRGLKLGAELSAPAWMVHTIRGLVCWWVLILGMQLMRVAWFACFTTRAPQQQPSTLADVELRKQISCSLQLSNKTDNHVAFKVKTTNLKKYCVRPSTGIVLPCSTCDVIVTMQAQREAPPDMQCKDKFLLQSAIASLGAIAKDITTEMVKI